MAKVYSAIEKFKRIEAALRDAGVDIRKAGEGVQAALGAERTDAERQALDRVQQGCTELLNRLREVIGHLYDAAR